MTLWDLIDKHPVLAWLVVIAVWAVAERIVTVAHRRARRRIVERRG